MSSPPSLPTMAEPRSASEPAGAAGPRPSPPTRRLHPAPWLAGALLVALGGLSLMHLLASNAFSAGRWAFGERAVALRDPGGACRRRDGVGRLLRDERREGVLGPPKGQMWYTAWWPSFRYCAVVTSSAIKGPALEIVFADPSAYRQYQFAGPPLPLFLYRVNVPGCP